MTAPRRAVSGSEWRSPSMLVDGQWDGRSFRSRTLGRQYWSPSGSLRAGGGWQARRGACVEPALCSVELPVQIWGLDRPYGAPYGGSGARPSFFPRRGGASPGSASLLAASNAALSRRWDGRGNELFACKRRSRAVVAIQVVQVVSGPRQSWPP